MLSVRAVNGLDFFEKKSPAKGVSIKIELEVNSNSVFGHDELLKDLSIMVLLLTRKRNPPIRRIFALVIYRLRLTIWSYGGNR